MSKIKFYYNRAEDTRNWFRHGENPPKFDQASLKKIIAIQIKALDALWYDFGNKIMVNILRALEIKNSPAQFKASLTTYHSCPYYEPNNWFMVSTCASLPAQLTNITHEILHILFIKNYKNLCLERGLTEKQFFDLVEALTVILNTKEFQNLLLSADKGYEKQQALRKQILAYWPKRKTFENFLLRIIKFIKKSEEK
jgi:hypothetical protein